MHTQPRILHPVHLVRACLAVGWKINDPDLPTHVAVAGGETDWDANAHFLNPATNDDSYGAWQINTKDPRVWAELQRKYGITRKDQLLDLKLNARIARDYFLARRWKPWGAYKNGRWREDGRIEAATAAVGIVKRNEDMSWTLAPSLKAAFAEANRIVPNRNKRSDGSIGDSSHAASASDHNPDSRGIVHAIDITHDPAGGFDSWAMAERIRQQRDGRVKYLIAQGAFCRSYDKPGIPAWTWSREKDWGHYSHVHISINSGAAENDLRPWFGGGGGGFLPDLSEAQQQEMYVALRGARGDSSSVVDGVLFKGADGKLYRRMDRVEGSLRRIEAALRSLGAKIEEHDEDDVPDA